MGILGRYDDAEDRVLPARAWRYDDSDDSASQSGESQDEHLAYVLFYFSSPSQISFWGYIDCCLQLRGSSSSSSSSNDGAGVGSTFNQSTGGVDMKLSILQSLHARDETMDGSCYATNGKDSRRLKDLLRSPPCECQCRVEFKVLRETCKAFWALPKESQDALLWSLQSGSGSRRKTWAIEGSLSYFLFNSFIIPRLILILKGSSCYRTHFPVLGVQICRTAWLKYLGIGKQRLQRTKKRFRGIDERTLAQQRSALCAVSFYFVKLF